MLGGGLELWEVEGIVNFGVLEDWRIYGCWVLVVGFIPQGLI